MDSSVESRPEPARATRRGLFAWAAMALGMAAAYGTAAFFALRYLSPRRRARTWRAFAGGVGDIPSGRSKTYTAPDGRKVVITNTGQGFVALSDVCPHLGCRVHWEEGRREFVCPCHNGVFDPQGLAVSGPPAKAGQRLARYEIEAADQALYITLREE